MGADVTLDLQTTTAGERLARVMDATGGRGVDVGIEGAGSPRAVEEGLGLVRDGGRYVIAGHTPVVGLIGLPSETATVFLFGFFRRDYGAAGLFDLNQAGVLDLVQLTVAAVTLTLFIPCIAQFLMMIRERGWKTAWGMFALITPLAFGVGFLLNIVLRGIGW